MTPERLEKITTVLANRQPDLAVVMEDIEDPHNIFAVMRTCDAVGIQDIYVINTVFDTYRKVGNSSSSSAAKWLTIHSFEHRDECMEVVQAKYDNVWASYLDDTAQSFYDIDYTKSTALVFGNERKGVTNDMLRYCNGTFVIPQSGMISSLNISVACAVTLYEAKRQRIKSGAYDGTPKLSRDHYSILKEKWCAPKDKKAKK